jgi:NhaP-type Na+/H+ or K+/H+ antiporter
MYQNAAVLAVFLLLYSAIAGRVERSWISGPIVFTAAGLVLGPFGLNAVHLDVAAEGLRLLAEATLAMVLFTDAANADLSVVRRNVGMPERLLLIGLPLSILLGFAVAWLLFPGLGVLELALLATMLAPTDAALGKPVVTNPAVPAATRESLNVESGLNDGICVPIVVILLGLAVGTQIEGDAASHVARVVAEAIGIGAAAGAVLPVAAALLLRWSKARNWGSPGWSEVPAVALAGACFAVAQALGGSGFIACFVGGLIFGRLVRQDKHAVLRGAENTGETLALLTWMLFGTLVVGQLFGKLTLPVVLYGVLSLTLIRMLPVFLCLIGTPIGAGERLFIGWFGPRGLASIVFAIMVFDADLPGHTTLMPAVAFTVLLSVIAHGITANPLTRATAGRSGAMPKYAKGP